MEKQYCLVDISTERDDKIINRFYGLNDDDFNEMCCNAGLILNEKQFVMLFNGGRSLEDYMLRII